MKAIDIFKLFVCIGVCELAGLAGSLVTRRAIPTWYASLQKPSFRPPDWVFGPVWTILYLLMGIAVFLVLTKGFSQPAVRSAVVAFIVQLVLNAAWSFLFFGLRSPLLGLIDILLLWAAIVVTMYLFWGVSRPAAVLMVPYILWVSFAAVLNFSIWRRNS